MSETFTKLERLLRRSDFVGVYEGGEKRFSRFFVLFLRPNSLSQPRLGITVTRKFGKSHDRNRVRRRIREIYRRSKDELGISDAGFDLVLNVKANAKDASFDDLRKDLLKVLRGVARR